MPHAASRIAAAHSLTFKFHVSMHSSSNPNIQSPISMPYLILVRIICFQQYSISRIQFQYSISKILSNIQFQHSMSNAQFFRNSISNFDNHYPISTTEIQCPISIFNTPYRYQVRCPQSSQFAHNSTSFILTDWRLPARLHLEP